MGSKSLFVVAGVAGLSALLFGARAEAEKLSNTRGLAAFCEFSSVSKYGPANVHGTTQYARNGKTGATVRTFPGVRDGAVGVYVLVDNLDNGRPVEVRFLPLSTKALEALKKQSADVSQAEKKTRELIDERFFMLDPQGRLKENKDMRELDGKIVAEQDPKKRIELMEQRLELGRRVLSARKSVLREMKESNVELEKAQKAQYDAVETYSKGIDIEFQTGTVPGYPVKVTFVPSSNGGYQVTQSGVGAQTVRIGDTPDPVDDAVSAKALEDDIKPAVYGFCAGAKAKRAERLASNAEFDKRAIDYCEADKKKNPADKTDCKAIVKKDAWGLEESSERLKNDLDLCSKFLSGEVRNVASNSTAQCPVPSGGEGAQGAVDGATAAAQRVK